MSNGSADFPQPSQAETSEASQQDLTLTRQHERMQTSRDLQILAASVLTNRDYNPFMFRGSGRTPDDPVSMAWGYTTNILKKARELANEPDNELHAAFFEYQGIYLAYDAEEQRVYGLEPKYFLEHDVAKLPRGNWRDHWRTRYNKDTNLFEVHDEQTGEWTVIKNNLLSKHTPDELYAPLRNAQQEMEEINNLPAKQQTTELANITSSLDQSLITFAQDQSTLEQMLLEDQHQQENILRTNFDKFIFLWLTTGKMVIEKAFQENADPVMKELAAQILPILVATQLATFHPDGFANTEAMLQFHDIKIMANMARHTIQMDQNLHNAFIGTIKDLIESTNPLITRTLEVTDFARLKQTRNADSNFIAEWISQEMLQHLMDPLTGTQITFYDRDNHAVTQIVTRNTNDPRALE